MIPKLLVKVDKLALYLYMYVVVLTKLGPVILKYVSILKVIAVVGMVMERGHHKVVTGA